MLARREPYGEPAWGSRRLISQQHRSANSPRFGDRGVYRRATVAGSVSAKVRRTINACELLLGIFTKRQKIARKQEWTTSAWVVDEKAYAFAKEKKLVLIKEEGVQSIGGLQGDYEYLELDRAHMADLLVRLVELFHGPDK
jgi:hypothetical protein